MANGPPTPDIGPPPGAGGSEGSPPGGQEAQSIIRPVQPQESAADVAAKAEAARAQEIQRKEGPEEALREVAGQQPKKPSLWRKAQVAVANSYIEMGGFNQGPSGRISAEDNIRGPAVPGEVEIKSAGSDTAVTNAPESARIDVTANAPGGENLTQEQIDEIARQLNEPDADRTFILGRLPDDQREAVMNRVRELKYGTSPEIPPATPVKPMTLAQAEASAAEARSRRILEDATDRGAREGEKVPEAEKPAPETEAAEPEKLKTGSIMEMLREAQSRQEAGEPVTQTPAEATEAPPAEAGPDETPPAEAAAEGGGTGAGEPPEAPPETPTP